MREAGERLRQVTERLGDAGAVALALLAVYTAGFGVFDNAWVSGLAVGLGTLVTFLGFGRGTAGGAGGRLLHLLLAFVFLLLLWRWLGIMLEQEEFFVEISTADHLLAWLAFAIVGYATWRAFGWPMLLVYALALAWTVAPDGIGGAGEHWQRVAENLWYSTDGGFGRPVEVVSRIVLVFVVFGAVLQTSGAGAVLLRLAFAATQRLPGGPAHAAVVGSALFGTMSGAAVANVVSTGVFTIPIMKRAGFPPRLAAAIEAAASTGGQIMPPVMGVVAFLMADVTGIPYIQIVVAATLPALFYYASLFAVVSLEARRSGLGRIELPPEERLRPGDALRSIAFFVPLAVLVWLLARGYTAQFGGFWALAAAFALALALFPEFRRPAAWWKALVDGGRTAATLMVIVTAIGVVVGVVNMTGIGLRFAQLVLALSGEDLLRGLVLVMLGSLVLGMGVPSAPAYLIVALVMGPALGQLGVPAVAAHLFMLYFAVLSVVTPPVALAAFAAAPLAGARPLATGFEALRLSVAGFVVPFLFVYHPDVLLIGGFDAGALLWAVLAFAIAIRMIATALARYALAPLAPPEVVLRLVAGVAVLVPDPLPAAAGVVLAAILEGRQRWYGGAGAGSGIAPFRRGGGP